MRKPMSRAETRRQKRLKDSAPIALFSPNTVPLTDELIRELLDTKQIEQEDLDFVIEMWEDEIKSGDAQLEWNAESKKMSVVGTTFFN